MSDNMQNQLNQLMEQAKQLQSNMEGAQKELSRQEVTGVSGAGMVKVVMTGRHDVKRVSITQEAFREGKTILEDLVAAAINDAVRKIEKSTREKMVDLTKGLNIPEGFSGDES